MLDQKLSNNLNHFTNNIFFKNTNQLEQRLKYTFKSQLPKHDNSFKNLYSSENLTEISKLQKALIQKNE